MFFTIMHKSSIVDIFAQMADQSILMSTFSSNQSSGSCDVWYEAVPGWDIEPNGLSWQ
jgi:hypothetical protein